MTTQNDIPEPEDCLECKDARNCTTTTFQTKVLTDPLPQVDQSITDYLSSLCECGHQLIPSFVSTMMTDKEYKLRERGEASVQNRIDRAAQGYR